MSDSKTYTITFSESVENHVGMQIIGAKNEHGFTCKKLEKISKKFTDLGYKTELINLRKNIKINKKFPDVRPNVKAKILIIRNGVQALLENNSLQEFYTELQSTDSKLDKKAWMRGRVVNKIARYNLCYGEENQSPDYENKKGTIIAFREVPLLEKIRENISKIFKTNPLLAELNCYYDIKKCYIGFHGDSERKLVIGLRLGTEFPLYFQWYLEGQTIGKREIINLKHGDMYVMSEKAVGTDWKKRKIPTLRHAAGYEENVN